MQQDVHARLVEAVRTLTSDEGSLKHRLMLAYVSQLLEIEPDRDLPEHLRERFQRLRIRLAQDEVVGDSGSVSRELEQMSDDDADEIARDIFALYLDVARDAPSSVPVRPR